VFGGIFPQFATMLASLSSPQTHAINMAAALFLAMATANVAQALPVNSTSATALKFTKMKAPGACYRCLPYAMPWCWRR